ncbi:unnamed protein product [Linum trigynum]|uniref:Uncharacterized protein n=1 Tax=Linum trigynum TaxID=586398 RepID=A0AAV2EYK3_9ROSI
MLTDRSSTSMVVAKAGATSSSRQTQKQRYTTSMLTSLFRLQPNLLRRSPKARTMTTNRRLMKKKLKPTGTPTTKKLKATRMPPTKKKREMMKTCTNYPSSLRLTPIIDPQNRFSCFAGFLENDRRGWPL